MLRPSTVLVALATSLALVSAQNFTTCCNIQPNSIPSDEALAWCRAQTNTCPLLCQNGQTANNTCDSTTLTYNCTCLTGNTPNISDYGQTLPSLECESWVGQCTAAHPNDLPGQTFCHSFICGKKNASAVGAGASSSSTAAGSSATGSSSGSTSATASSSLSSSTAKSSSGAVAALKMGKEYGTTGVVVGLLALFGFAL